MGAAKSLHRGLERSAPARAVIVPDVSLPDSLSDAEMREVAESVHLSDHRSDIPSVMAASDMFVLPSYGEGLPRVLLEAASMQLPIVATQARGCREIVQDGVNGYLVPVGQSESLARAVKSLADSAPLREDLGRAGRHYVMSRFHVSLIYEETKQTYLHLLRANR